MTEKRLPEVHIASFIVHHQPGQGEAIGLALSQMQGIEPQQGELASAGKQVVICEAPDQRYILDHMDAIEQLPGVYGCSLVYHEVMSAPEADQQMITDVRSA